MPRPGGPDVRDAWRRSPRGPIAVARAPSKRRARGRGVVAAGGRPSFFPRFAWRAPRARSLRLPEVLERQGEHRAAPPRSRTAACRRPCSPALLGGRCLGPRVGARCAPRREPPTEDAGSPHRRPHPRSRRPAPPDPSRRRLADCLTPAPSLPTSSPPPRAVTFPSCTDPWPKLPTKRPRPSIWHS